MTDGAMSESRSVAFGPMLQSIEIITPTEGDYWSAHDHERHELLSAISGLITVATDDRIYIVPRGSAIWLPAGCVHAVRAWAGNRMRCTWFEASALPEALTDPTVLTVSRLLEDVLAHLDTDNTAARRHRAEAFALDLLSVGAKPDDGLGQPSTPWLRSVTTALAANPGDDLTIAQWADRSAVSVRTFTRHFQLETGLTFSQWRTRLRVQAAIARLAAGEGVRSVSRAVGFTSPSAFATAFRRETGIAPSSLASPSKPF